MITLPNKKQVYPFWTIAALPMIDQAAKRLSRLIALLTLLQTKRILPASQLASRFSVSIRTIYRDMRSLESAGIPIFTEEGKGYSLVEGYRLPPMMLTDDEANAFITAGQLVVQNKDGSLINHYEEALCKVKAVLQEETRDKANLLSTRIKVYTNPQFERTSHYLSSLQKALTHFLLVDISYVSAAGEQSCRLIEPFALLSTQNNWLVVAFCRLRNTFRLFRLDRITSLHTLQERFAPHKLTLKEYFEKYGK